MWQLVPKTSLKIVLLTVFAVSVQLHDMRPAFADPVCAQMDTIVKKTMNRYADDKEIYLKQIDQSFMALTKGADSIDRETLQERLRENILAEAARRQWGDMLFYDENYDGQVTLAEVKKLVNYGFISVYSSARQMHFSYNADGKERIEKRIRQVMEADRDGDGTITQEEMAVLDEKTIEKVLAGDNNKKYMQRYLRWVSGESVLTRGMFLQRAAYFFDELDEDRNGQLSEQELICARRR